MRNLWNWKNAVWHIRCYLTLTFLKILNRSLGKANILVSSLQICFNRMHHMSSWTSSPHPLSRKRIIPKSMFIRTFPNTYIILTYSLCCRDFNLFHFFFNKITPFFFISYLFFWLFLINSSALSMIFFQFIQPPILF